MPKPKPRPVKAKPPTVTLTAGGQTALAAWSTALLEAASLSAIAPIVEQVKSYDSADRAEALKQVARELKDDSLPLLRELTTTEDRALQLDTLVATSQVRSEEAAEIISPLAEHGDAEVRKAARRALEHLRSLGVRATVPMGSGIIGEAEPIERFQEALLSSINGLGQRMLSLAQRVPGRGIAVAQVAVDEVRGVYDCAVALVRRHEYDAMAQALTGDPTRAIASAPWEYGVHLLREARAANDASQTPPPESFHDLDLILAEEKCEPYARALVYEHLNAEALDRPALVAASAALFDQPMFMYWVLPQEVVRPLADQLKDAGESWVVISESAQQERMASIMRDTVERVFDATGRARYARRLEEMAYLLLDTGHAEAGRVALAVALDLKAEGCETTTLPFVQTLIGRSLTALPSSQGDGDDEPRIALPYGGAR